MKEDESKEHIEDDIEVIEESITSIPISFHKVEGKEEILYMPLLEPNGNMLIADLTDFDQTIVGLWYKTKSGHSEKVGVSGTSRQELRQVLSFGIVSKNWK